MIILRHTLNHKLSQKCPLAFQVKHSLGRHHSSPGSVFYTVPLSIYGSTNVVKDGSNQHLALLPLQARNGTLSKESGCKRFLSIQPTTHIPGNRSLSETVAAYYKFMRLHTLTPVLIFWYPAMWSAVAALPPVFGLEEAKKMGLFFLGAFFARTAGCCVNDIADRNIDKHVERTKTRPLAAGLISKREALGILTVNASLGFLVLMQFDLNTIRFGLFTALGACIYPFMKRFINYPQLVLGLASNIGVFIGWSAMMQPFTLTPLLIYLASSLWTVIYDTVYAHQDKRFDKHIGVKSLALHWGDRTKRNCNIAALGMSALLAAAGYNAELNKCFYGALALSHIWMTRQIKLVDLEDSTSCLTFFKRSILYGALVLGGIATGKDVSFQVDK